MNVRDVEARKEIFNTLNGLVKALEGHHTVIDLRNESCVCGKIVNVDGFMNIDMTDVVLYDNRGAKHAFTNFFVSNRTIRYVHIPKNVSAIELMQKQLDGMRYHRKNKHRTFKQSRAQKYQQETLEYAYRK